LGLYDHLSCARRLCRRRSGYYHFAGPGFLAGLADGCGCRTNQGVRRRGGRLHVLAWALAAAFGISAILAGSTLLYHFLQWAGAAYLCWLGVRLLLTSRKSQRPSASPDIAGSRPDQWFSIGLLTNISNPKVGVFYVSLLPQFVPDGVSAGPFMAALAAIHIAEGAVWFALLILATRPLGRWLARPHVQRKVDRLTGVILIGLGMRLTLDRR
jgi:threonine/homoserine/homoserine lactone efflux protein